jgi:DNA-binding NtrC family response regulator
MTGTIRSTDNHSIRYNHTMPTSKAAPSPWFTQKDRQLGDVLVLEDDLDLQTAIRDFLDSRGYRVVVVNNGAEGIRKIVEADFDAIICDMIMPAFPGDMFYTATSRVKPHLCGRFIFITGDSGRSSATDFIRSVNGTVLYKPFRLAYLEWAMQEIRDKTGPAKKIETMTDWGSLKPEERGERDFFGSYSMVDYDARKFVFHEATAERVRMIECSFSQSLQEMVMECQNMRVTITGSVERSGCGRRFVVRVKSIQRALEHGQPVVAKNLLIGGGNR